MDVDHLRALVIAERNLVRAIEAARPYIKSNNNNNNNTSRIYPIPKTMNEVSEILALSHTLASRTSAPIGWDPATMAITTNFATPAPLPHQLRAGNVGGLQLKLASMERSGKEITAKKKEVEAEEVDDADMEDVVAQKDLAAAATQSQLQQKRQRPVMRREDAGARAKRKTMATMKIDSSSSSDESSGGEEESESE